MKIFPACFLLISLYSNVSAFSLARARATQSPYKTKSDTNSIIVAAMASIALSICPVHTNAAESNTNTKGRVIFQQNCYSCHAGGKNAIAKTRTLDKNALEEFLHVEDIEDISTFVRHSDVHRGALLFAGRMTEEDYKDVAKFVFDQAMNEKW